jgi:hypothetical protein
LTFSVFLLPSGIFGCQLAVPMKSVSVSHPIYSPSAKLFAAVRSFATLVSALRSKSFVAISDCGRLETDGSPWFRLTVYLALILQ